MIFILEKKKDYYQYALFHTISDFADLSLTEIIILQFLVRYTEPVVRHVLYTEVKQFIEFKETEIDEVIYNSDKFMDFINLPKKLSTGKFYYSLDKLEKRGLLTFNGTTGKVSINPTSYTNFIPKLLLKFLINNEVIESTEFQENFNKVFLEKLDKSKLNRVLSVWFSEYIPVPVLNQLSSFCSELYILSKNEFIKNEKKSIFRHSEIVGGLFREREDFFDATIIPIYKKSPKFYRMPRKKILEEVIRVTKPNGQVIIVSIADFEMTENVFINELIKLYKSALNNRIFTHIELFDDLNNSGFKNIEIFDYQGHLIGIANNP